MTLDEAITYLRGRGKYIIDPACKWRPTLASATDVSKTFAAYRRDEAKKPERAPVEKSVRAPVAQPAPAVVRYFKRRQ